MLKRLMSRLSHQNRTFLVAIALLGGGISMVGVGVANQIEAPMPPPVHKEQPPAQSAISEFANNALPASEPVSLSIPAINVNSNLIQVGKNPDGTIEVPEGNDYDKAAWYKYSSMPGQLGPSIIEGHIDSAKNGPSVFFNLGKLKPGDIVKVSREDDSTAVFEIDKIAIYKKNEFPTEKVYGPTKYAALRLITCGGVLNHSTGTYDSNIIAFGHLVR